MERRLATILALDVVGFSKMMGEDEAHTLQNLEKNRQRIDYTIKDNQGRIFNTAGDSVLAEFSSPVKAVECAVQIQGQAQANNFDLEEKEKMHFRIGINLGDVMDSDGNLFGDAVNITLGTPIIRTSVDHGTALELAGTNNVSTKSLAVALKQADQML